MFHIATAYCKQYSKYHTEMAWSTVVLLATFQVWVILDLTAGKQIYDLKIFSIF